MCGASGAMFRKNAFFAFWASLIAPSARPAKPSVE